MTVHSKIQVIQMFRRANIAQRVISRFIKKKVSFRDCIIVNFQEQGGDAVLDCKDLFSGTPNI